MIERGRQQLRDAATRLTEQGLPEVHQELRLGNIFHGIRQMITDHDVDLIVMGTSGLTKFEEILVGSNTEKVVRFSKCPVLTVHQRWDSLTTIKDIVYATSMVENEKHFSTVVKRTQEIFGAKVHLVRINTPMNFQPDVTVKKVMEEFAHKNRLTNYTLNIFNDYSEDEGIIHFANDIKADLIAMATHGRTGLSHVLVGSIAEDVVNHAARPVLTWVTR
jgi:nucleotide-binding universal stress UspA family protein